MTNTTTPDWTSRQAATNRAIETTTCNPANLLADDAATVVHVTGTTPLFPRHEDIYICLGGAHDQAMVDHLYRDDSSHTAVVVSVHYREGITCKQAADAMVD